MDRETTILAGTILLSTGLVIAYVWSSHNRYQVAETGGNYSYEVDRLTGKTWFVSHNRKTLVSE